MGGLLASWRVIIAIIAGITALLTLIYTFYTVAVQPIKNELALAQATITSQKEDIRELGDTAETQSKDIKDLKADISRKDEEIQGKSEEIQKLKAKFDHVNKTIGDLEGTIKDIKRKIPPPPWPFVITDVDEHQGDSVSVSWNEPPFKKNGQRWEFKIPDDIPAIVVEWTKQDQDGLVWIPRTQKREYTLDELEELR